MKHNITLGMIVIICCCLSGCWKDDSAKKAMTRKDIDTIQTAIRIHEVKNSMLPDSLDQLTVGVGEEPPILKREYLFDRWGTPFQYKKIGKFDFEIRSAGPDKKMNTDDDLTN